MGTQKRPQESSGDKESEGPHIHRPEFIILESEEEQGQSPHAQKIHSEYFETIQGLNKIQFPWTLRILIFFTLFFVLIGTVIVTFFFIISLLFAALAFFQSKTMNDNMVKSWKNVKKLCVFSAGMFLAIFSPALGLGLIVLYLMLQGEHLNKAIMERLFKTKLGS